MFLLTASSIGIITALLLPNLVILIRFFKNETESYYPTSHILISILHKSEFLHDLQYRILNTLKLNDMKLAIVGATGLVGGEMLKVVEERNFEFGRTKY